MFARKMWGCLLVLIVCYSPLVSSDEKRCPTNIQPCTCYRLFPTFIASITCSNISDQAVLQDVFNRSNEHFPDFSLSESSVKYIPSRALIQKNTMIISVRQSTLYNLFDQQPVENHKVTHINWIESRLLCGNLWKQLKPLKELQDLYVYGFPSAEIGKKFEQSISPTIRNIYVLRTNTTKLSPTIFQKLVNLEHIQISQARLTTLKRTMFPAKNSIRVLDFSTNFIKSLPDDVFSNMPSIDQIDLRGNQLKIFSEAVFGCILDKGAWVILKDNPISCDCSFKWVLYKTQVQVYGKCSNPSSRKGKDFRDLRPEDFSYCPNSVPMLLETPIELQ